MEGFDPRASFGYDESQRYDAVDTRVDEEETVAFLARLTGPGDALELAVGTGRIALPLASAGVRVDGIELSEDMVDRMREKPGADQIAVVIGDMSRITTGRRYGLVYLVYNTIGNLLTQDDQVRCFENAARHLADHGVFVLECRVPAAPTRPGRQYVDAERVTADEVVLDVCRYGPVSQVLDESHVHLTASGIVLRPVSLRLACPPEFDLMARIAGLRLRDRWGGWNGEPFTAASWRHVSVYEPATVRAAHSRWLVPGDDIPAEVLLDELLELGPDRHVFSTLLADGVQMDHYAATMADSADRAWTGSMPDIYERCLAAAVFGPPAADLARRAAAHSPSAILELAAGTGTLTRQLIRRLPGAKVTATDLNQAMVGYGAQRVPEATWRQADALSLPFDDALFDLVICQFGVMFFGAKPAAFSQVARVLRPDGRFLFNTWDVIEHNDFAAALAAAIETAFPADPPTFLARIPHGYADLAALAADLRAAGLEPEEQSTVVMASHAESAAQLATGFCSGTPLRMAIEARGALQPAIETIAAQMTARLGTGPVSGRLTAHVIAARPAPQPGGTASNALSTTSAGRPRISVPASPGRWPTSGRRSGPRRRARSHR